MRVLVLRLAAVLVLATALAGCGAPAAPPGVPQQQYDALSAQLTAAQGQVTALQAQVDRLNQAGQAAAADKAGIQAQLTAAQAQVSQLQNDVSKLKQDSQLAGSTPAETALKIIKLYHETHVYSTYDLFVCGDMAQEVWNMLKAQNINAKIQIGNTKTAVKEMTDSDHAWVLAEIASGTYLALETTGGFSVTQSENPLYYQGWSFKSPKDFKDYTDLLNEYNLRLSIVNDMGSRYNDAGKDLEQANAAYSQMVTAFNAQYAGKPITADSRAAQDKVTAQQLVVREKQGRVSQALDEYNRQKTVLPGILTKMKGMVG